MIKGLTDRDMVEFLLELKTRITGMRMEIEALEEAVTKLLEKLLLNKGD